MQLLFSVVDPFIGTGATNNPGNVFPGASVPFGMAKLGIDVGECMMKYRSEEQSIDKVFSSQSHTHLLATTMTLRRLFVDSAFCTTLAQVHPREALATTSASPSSAQTTTIICAPSHSTTG
jgi:putative alpha-1,2-mannosidase